MQDSQSNAMKQNNSFYSVTTMMESTKLQKYVISDHFKNNNFDDLVIPHKIYEKTIDRALKRTEKMSSNPVYL